MMKQSKENEKHLHQAAWIGAAHACTGVAMGLLVLSLLMATHELSSIVATWESRT